METKPVPAGACVGLCCACLLLGLGIGYLAWHRPAPPQGIQTIRVIPGGTLRPQDVHPYIQDQITHGK